MRHALILSLSLLLLLHNASQAIGNEAVVQDGSACPSGLIATRLAGIITGTSAHPRLAFNSIEELPEILRNRWAAAKAIQFPLSRVDAAKGVDIRDIWKLRALSEDGLLTHPDVPLGWIKEKDIFVEVASDIRGEDSTTRQVLLNIKGRRYRIEVKRPNVRGEVAGGGYRVAAKPESVWTGVMSWEGLSEKEQAWLHSRDALGVSVMTPEGKVFTRVEHAVLDKMESYNGIHANWRDEETGLVWSSPAKERMNWEEAKAYCKGIGAELPTKQMLEVLSAAKGYHLISDRNNRWFWSSSAHPGVSGDAYGLNGNDGYVGYYGYRGSRYSVVCVAR